MLTLISATPSPYARMNRIALAEKGIPFELQNEIPWHDDTKTPQYNPLEQLPILLFDDGTEPVYHSAHIQDYIVTKYADKGPSLLTGNVDLDLKAKQLVLLSVGLMDAFVQFFFETKRGDKMSQPWLDRWNRKIDGCFKALNEMAKNRKGDYLLGDSLTIGDIGVVCGVGQVDWGNIREGWKSKYPDLAEYYDKLDARPIFAETKPVMFDLQDVVV